MTTEEHIANILGAKDIQIATLRAMIDKLTEEKKALQSQLQEHKPASRSMTVLG